MGGWYTYYAEVRQLCDKLYSNVICGDSFETCNLNAIILDVDLINKCTCIHVMM